MNGRSYRRFKGTQLTLPDLLAVDRTVLANERTFLAYLRTTLALVILGVTFMQLLDGAVYHAVGYTFLVFSVLMFFVGMAQFVRMKKRLNELPRD
jgi:putative membrane protein